MRKATSIKRSRDSPCDGAEKTPTPPTPDPFVFEGKSVFGNQPISPALKAVYEDCMKWGNHVRQCEAKREKEKAGVA